MTQSAAHPVGGVDYPRTLVEFEQWFSSETACHEFLRRLRWPHGFECPACGRSGGWETSRGLVRCPQCERQTSVTAGTLFEGTRKPLRVWFQAIWYLTNQKHGVSALGLQRILGLGSYQTAWTWLHKLRRAMVRPDREQLSGEIEVDETFLGGEGDEIAGRGTDRFLIVMACEIRGRGTGRVRMAPAATPYSSTCGRVKIPHRRDGGTGEVSAMLLAAQPAPLLP
jgi:transposase-like protein